MRVVSPALGSAQTGLVWRRPLAPSTNGIFQRRLESGPSLGGVRPFSGRSRALLWAESGIFTLQPSLLTGSGDEGLQSWGGGGGAKGWNIPAPGSTCWGLCPGAWGLAVREVCGLLWLWLLEPAGEDL